MNPLQKKYCELRASGMAPQAASVKAGYSEKTSKSHCYKLEKRADIQNFISQLRQGMSIADGSDETIQAVAEHIHEKSYTKSADYTSDPLEFLERQMNNPIEDMKVRIDCAKALAPYRHQKKGESGKTASKQEAAEETAQKSKFTPRIASA